MGEPNGPLAEAFFQHRSGCTALITGGGDSTGQNIRFRAA
jgi:hypothetical protein